MELGIFEAIVYLILLLKELTENFKMPFVTSSRKNQQNEVIFSKYQIMQCTEILFVLFLASVWRSFLPQEWLLY